MREQTRQRISKLIWGTDTTDCEECGRTLPPDQAMWRGRHPYCSIEHEAAAAA
jgi:hypothetical protein